MVGIVLAVHVLLIKVRVAQKELSKIVLVMVTVLDRVGLEMAGVMVLINLMVQT